MTDPREIIVCPECDGKQGRSYTWDDDLGIRHEDWVNCPACQGRGVHAVIFHEPPAPLCPDFLTPNGSRLYGVHVDGSDYDYLGAQAASKQQVLSLGRPWEQTEWKGDGFEGVVYELRKYVRLVAEGNPTMLATLFGQPSIDTFGICTDEFREMVVSAAAQPKFIGYMDSQIKRMSSGSGMHVTRAELVERYGFDTKYAGHIVRLGLQGVEYLTTGRMVLPMSEPDRSLVRSIRLGEVPYDEVIKLAESLRTKLTKLSGHSLRPSADWDALGKWLVAAYDQAWSS